MSRTGADELWYAPTLDVFLNRWFSNYDDARAARASGGGFLLPYRQHFFVCEAAAVRAMGLEPDDPDWERIGWDGARPQDAGAYRRLSEKRLRAAREAHG